MLKTKVIKCIEAYQVNLVEALQNELENFQSGSDIDEEDIIDSDTRSHQSQSTFDEHRVNEQLERAEADLEHLRSIPNEPADIIKEGALIETNNLLLYVGIITKTITEDGKEIIGISTDAPIFKTLVGQKKGFQFKLANSDCSILSIQ